MTTLCTGVEPPEVQTTVSRRRVGTLRDQVTPSVRGWYSHGRKGMEEGRETDGLTRPVPRRGGVEGPLRILVP